MLIAYTSPLTTTGSPRIDSRSETEARPSDAPRPSVQTTLPLSARRQASSPEPNPDTTRPRQYPAAGWPSMEVTGSAA